MEQELPTLPENLSSLLVFSGFHVTRSLVLCVMFCRSLFVLFFWPLRCLSFFDLEILITPLVSSNYSSICRSHTPVLLPSFLTYQPILTGITRHALVLHVVSLSTIGGPGWLNQLGSWIT